MKDEKLIVSASRTYVAMCNKTNFDGFYFRQFTLPENTAENRARIWGGEAKMYEGPGMLPRAAQFQISNDSDFACWFFLNELNHSACIGKCIPLEDFQDVSLESSRWDAEVPV